MNRERTVAFDEERLAIVKDRLRDVMLSTITGEMIEELPRPGGSSMGSATAQSTWTWGALRKVLKRYGHWRRLQDHVTI